MGGKFLRGYDRELGYRSQTYKKVVGSDLDPLRKLVLDLARAPTAYVASGGALAVAQFAADLQHAGAGTIGVALSPLRYVSRANSFHSTLVVSASGRNPDAKLAVECSLGADMRPTALLTCRPRSSLPRALQAARVVSIDSGAPKDGFLATNSIIALCTALARAWSSGPAPELEFQARYSAQIKDRCLVLHGAGCRAAAVDLETRLAETGLSACQVADYRNFAHGRHLGFWRNLDSTTVVALITPESVPIAEATLALLPTKADILRLRTAHAFPYGTIDLLGKTMTVVGKLSRSRGLNASRPGVPRFGRSLYHLPITRLLRPPPNGPVIRKLNQLGPLRDDESVVQELESAFREWLERRNQEQLSAVVLDYDGTCCTTEGRRELPNAQVQGELLRLLDAGVRIGFASGRGKSLYRDLRKWVPERHWSNIQLALYNGGLQLTLADPIGAQDQCEGDLLEAYENLLSSPFANHVLMDPRRAQLGIRVRDGRMSVATLMRLVQATLRETSQEKIKVVCSGHSVDLVPLSSSKAQLVKLLAVELPHKVLAIGDQGQVGGNDFELLASVESSLSVDRCSASPTRCWNLSSGRGERGPDLLIRYLRALQSSGDVVRFNWKVGRA